MHELIDYAKRFIGLPYKWGGNNPITGMDCSGFLQWVLDSVGIDPRGDQTAQTLYEHFSRPLYGLPLQSHAPGAIVFYGKSLKAITHIDLAINKDQVIGAIGGGSKTLKLSDAAKDGACVKVKHREYRHDVVAIIFPTLK